MKLKSFIVLLILSFTVLSPFHGNTQCNIQASICEAGTMSQSFNFVSTSGSYAGGAFANAGCSTGAAGQHRYGFITLYITQSGYLNLLIDGNSNSGFIDVAIFRVPNGVAPCTAIQSSSNAIGCNYASSAGGCVEFGSNFPCASEVPAPYVNAGDEIMIVAQSYTSGTSTTFQLQLSDAPGTAQTGIPDASINPTEPFCATGGPIQLTAVNMGGTWSGPGVSSTGMFNPQSVGPGSYTINYSIGISPCNASSSSQVVVGSMNISNMNVGGCAAGTHNVTGTVNVVSPPSTGHLMVQNCDGQQMVVASAPFSSGSYPFNLTGLDPNGAPCQIQAYFADNQYSHSLVYCSHVLQYTAPTCTSNCLFTSINATPTGCDTGNTYTLNGSVSFINAPSSGQLIIEDCSGNSQTFNAPFSSPTNYSISSLTPNGASCTVTARFTDNTNCTTSTSYTAPSIPVVTASPDIGICPGVTVNLSASGADNYLWDNGAGNSENTTVSPTSTTTYTVTGTTNGCTATEQVTVTIETNSLSPSISPADSTICEGASIYISSSGGISYSWGEVDLSGPTPVPGPVIYTGDSIIVSPSTTTTYYVYIEDADGCTGGNAVTITVNPIPDAQIANPSVLYECLVSPTVQLGGTSSTPGVTYLWTGNGFVSGQTTTSPVVNATGVYTMTVTDPTTGCTNSTDVTVIGDGNEPDVSIDPTVDISCDNPTITLTANSPTPGTTFQWTSNPGIVSGETTLTPTVNQAGTYQITVSAGNGCTNSASIIISGNADLPVINSTPPSAISCDSPMVTVDGSSTTPGVTYSWAGPGIALGQGTGIITVHQAGTYTVTVANSSNNCVNTQTFTVTGNTNVPDATISNSPTIDCNNITVPLNGASSSPGATASWAGPGIVTGGNTFVPTVNAQGTYVLTVTDPSNNCTNTVSVTVDEIVPVTPWIFPDTSLCMTSVQIPLGAINANGNVVWTEANGNGTFTNPNSLTPIFTATNGITDYILTFTDECGYSLSVNLILESPHQIVSPAVSCNMAEFNITTQSHNGGIWSVVENPNTPYVEDTTLTFIYGDTITGGLSNTAVSVSYHGTYTLHFTSSGACPDTSITLNFPPYLWTQIDDTTLCRGAEHVIKAVESPYNNVTYQWNNGSTGTSLAVNQSGEYTVTVSNVCHSYTDTAIITFIACDIDAPNIISLSSQSGNNLWFVEGDGITDFNCIIVNRWGNLIHEYNDVNGHWDGRDRSGNVVPEGVYFYTIEATVNGGEELKKQGFIHVVH